MCSSKGHIYARPLYPTSFTEPRIYLVDHVSPEGRRRGPLTLVQIWGAYSLRIIRYAQEDFFSICAPFKPSRKLCTVEIPFLRRVRRLAGTYKTERKICEYYFRFGGQLPKTKIF